MRRNTILSVGLLLALASTSALAFQEQGGADQVAPDAAAALAGDTAAPEAALAPGASTKAPAAGTEVRIPGLGKLGVLPKMDFGLELLYGANEPKPVETEGEAPASDLTIRGSIKHPF
jgi:hypothetical protein